jgi:hypothetical protein
MDNLLHEREENLGVVYLSWLPYGIDYLKKFIESYKKNAAGIKHHLIILFNGTALSGELNQFLAYAQSNLDSFEYETMPSGPDIDAYFQVAGKRSETFLLFLNSFTEFTCAGWLKLYADTVQIPGAGLIGATASNQSLYSTVYQSNKWYWETDKNFRHNFRKYKLFLKAFFYWRFLIRPFPNPHIRTNGFMIKREIFLSLKKGRLKKKFDAYLFENGRNSMTNQVLKFGYKTLVIGKNGMSYEMSKWKNSHTFWIAEQENLLVRDNQTEMYQNATPEYRRLLTYLSWGNHG